MSNRERLPRRAVRFPIRFWRADRPQDKFQAFVSNVSAGGMYIATRRPLPPGTRLEVAVERPEGTVTIAAEVVHAARMPVMYQRVFGSGMGVRFERPDDPAVRAIAELGVALPDRGGRRRSPR